MIKIFVLNLKRSPERRKLIQSQMEKFGLKFEFIDAVDGNELT
ncbi:MAG: glycosyltransferase family 25 protein, partial [Alphaproteobacteria bacterium]|nr:glycosyltransferase family 25 protein [Alphaproteobacteria bacterium]